MNGALPEIRVEAYDKIDHWRDKLDQAAKLKKRDVFERAAADLFLEAEHERDLRAVQAITDAVYFLGRDHAGLCDDDIQYVMASAKTKAECRPTSSNPLNNFPLVRDAGELPQTGARADVSPAGTNKTTNPVGQNQLRLKSARAATYQIAAVKWLWPSRFAIGKLGILAGLPDEGKGQVLADMAARTTRASEWPCGEGFAPLGNVILLTAEDGIEDTVVPRLLAAGADLDRIEIVSMVIVFGNRDRMFNLGTDLDLLRQKIAEVGDVKLVLIDPISAYLGTGKIDSFRTTDVRAVLGPLVDLANELGVAFVGIMHFNKKMDVTNALLRISDSLAFGAAARHVYAVVDDAENKRKLLVRAKNNLAPATKALAYSFSVREVGRDAKTDQTIYAPHVIWHPKHVDVTASEAMQAATEAKSPTARDEAKKFLADLLANGPVTKNDIEEAAQANGVAERTLFRANSSLKIIAKKDGPNGEWTWRLPSQPKRWDRD
jgi:hypothetical protein